MLEVISAKKALLGLKLPLEIVDLILDHAEFWPHSTCTTQYRTVVYSDVKEGLWQRDWRSLPFSMDHGPIPDNYRIMPKNAFLLRTHPLGVQTRDPSAPIKSGVVSRWKQKLKRDRRCRGSSGLTWLPPRGLRPCREYISEFLFSQISYRQDREICRGSKEPSRLASAICCPPISHETLRRMGSRNSCYRFGSIIFYTNEALNSAFSVSENM